MNAQNPAFNLDGPIDHIESAKINFLLVISGFLRHRILFYTNPYQNTQFSPAIPFDCIIHPMELYDLLS